MTLFSFFFYTCTSCVQAASLSTAADRNKNVLAPFYGPELEAEDFRHSLSGPLRSLKHFTLGKKTHSFPLYPVCILSFGEGHFEQVYHMSVLAHFDRSELLACVRFFPLCSIHAWHCR
jgi:hypothetical protein